MSDRKGGRRLAGVLSALGVIASLLALVPVPPAAAAAEGSPPTL
jgi:hypothetical protein